MARSFTVEEAIAETIVLGRFIVAFDRTIWKDQRLDVVSQDVAGIELGHGFYDVESLPENDRRRYTIPPGRTTRSAIPSTDRKPPHSR